MAQEVGEKREKKTFRFREMRGCVEGKLIEW
jgi:hypothetical protein